MITEHRTCVRNRMFVGIILIAIPVDMTAVFVLHHRALNAARIYSFVCDMFCCLFKFVSLYQRNQIEMFGLIESNEVLERIHIPDAHLIEDVDSDSELDWCLS